MALLLNPSWACQKSCKRIIETELARHVTREWLRARVDEINRQLGAAGKPPLQRKSIPQGAATSLWAAVVAPADEIDGRYCENCHAAAVVPSDAHVGSMVDGVRGYAVDPNNADALWKKSEEMVGGSF